MIITIDGINETFELLGQAVIDAPEKIVVAVTEDVYENAKRNIIPHTKTGRLEANLQFRVNMKNLSGEVYIDNQGMMVDWKGKPTNYALFVHFGSKPHVIEPKDKKALRWAGLGGFIFAKKVHHQGYKGDPFMHNASKETFKNLDKIFKRVYDEL